MAPTKKAIVTGHNVLDNHHGNPGRNQIVQDVFGNIMAILNILGNIMLILDSDHIDSDDHIDSNEILACRLHQPSITSSSVADRVFGCDRQTVDVSEVFNVIGKVGDENPTDTDGVQTREVVLFPFPRARHPAANTTQRWFNGVSNLFF